MDTLDKIKNSIGPALFVYLVMIVLYYFGVKHYYSGSAQSELAKCALFGEMFGGFSALFAGLGFVAVAITTYFQIEQYNNNREQSHRYQVENTFFNMLNTLSEIVATSYYQDEYGEQTEYKGRAYFHYAMRNLRSEYGTRIEPVRQRLFMESAELRAMYVAPFKVPVPAEISKTSIVIAYETFYKEHEHNLGHYFRYLYNIFKFLLANFPDDTEITREYIGLIQAQMSNDELGLLFYNAISKHGRNIENKGVFHQWLEEYDFFENIDERCIFHDAFLEFYPKTNFKYKLRDGWVKIENGWVKPEVIAE